MTDNAYEARQAARRKRYLSRADNARTEAVGQFQRSRDLTAGIPMGQPVLIGHHSEKRHRRTLERSDTAIRRGIEAENKAKHYAGKAAGVGKAGISSDDPDAPDKLRERIAELEAKQERMKAANKALRSGDEGAQAQKLAEMGYSVAMIGELMSPDYAGRRGYPSYSLTNNNANVRRLKERLERLEVAREAESVEYEVGGVTIVENVEENRLQMFFPGKPSAEVRSRLKSRGFRWSRANEAWQRHLSNAARYVAREIAEGLEG